MKVTHSFGSHKVSKEIKDDVGFILTNKIGGFCYFNSEPKTKFEGFFCKERSDVYRVIERIEPLNSGSITELHNHFSYTERLRERNREEFFVPDRMNVLVYELKRNDDIKIFLDVKQGYDMREWGRFYDVKIGEESIEVTFTKKTDQREDKTDGKKEYEMHLVIKGDIKGAEKLNSWTKRYYDEDYRRHSSPFERYVFDALKLNGKRFVFAVSMDKESAIREADHALNSIRHLKKQKSDQLRKSQKKIQNKEILMAYIAAKNSLDSLIVRDEKDCGIYAGLPWFFQFWTRDEALALKALISDQEDATVKKILLRDIINIKKDGNLPNRFPPTETGNADAVGWAFKRVQDLIGQKRIELDHKKGSVADWLRYSIHALVSSSTKDGFAVNKAKETWMDTEFKGDAREGARIEIQAMRMNMYKLMSDMTGEKEYFILEHNLKEKVFENLWNGRWLCDGLDDETIRPNIFIAAYIYPELLKEAEWQTCFEICLNECYLPWGGISTIERTSPLFTDECTGENVESYHRGDSWFYLNNLSALMMHRVDKAVFKQQIERILSASTEEILWKGAVGHHGEVSSARELRSENCKAMAWSAAMFIELIEEAF